MKRLYNINKIVIIINLILVIIPFLGLVFMFITGCVQVISYSVCLMYWKRINSTLRNYFIVYPFLVSIALGTLYIGTDTSYAISMSIAALLAIGFLFLLKKQKDLSLNTTTDEL